MKHEIILSTVIAVFLIWEPMQIGKSQLDSTTREKKLQALQKSNDENKADILQLANSLPDKPKIIIQKKIIPVPIVIPKIVYIRVTEEDPTKKKNGAGYIPINRNKLKLIGLDSLILNKPKIQLPKRPGFFKRLFHKRKIIKENGKD